MINIRAILVALCLLISPADAQITLTGAGLATPGPTYTGPGDIVSGATAWWGLRAYNAAYATGSNNAINIRRASDNTTSNIVILANGNLDVATATTFCNATTCFVTEWFDQTGNGNNLAEATAADQPQLVLSCLGSNPCLLFNGTSDTLVVAWTTQSQPFTWSVVSEVTGSFTSNGEMVRAGNNSGTDVLFRHSTSANTINMFAGTLVNGTASDSAWHIYQAVFQTTTSVFNIDGTGSSVSVGTNTAKTNFAVGSIPLNAGEFFHGDISEVGVWPSALSSGNQTSVCHNQFVYWGTSTSC